MRSLRYAALPGLLVLALPFAHAYKANILDPPSATTVPTTIETSDMFRVTFDACQPGELPGGNTGSGCFALFNRSGNTWTSLTLSVPDNTYLGGQGVQCNTDPNHLAYPNDNCGYNPATGRYTLLFDGGSFPSGTSNTLFIVETGINYKDFPTFDVTAGTATTPEPNTILLLATGLSGTALLVRRRYRGAVR